MIEYKNENWVKNGKKWGNIRTFSYNNLGMHRVIICLTAYLCITKNKKSFCRNCIRALGTFSR